MLIALGGVAAFIIGMFLLFGQKIISGLPVYMWNDFLIFLKGMISSGLVIGGILIIISGISAIRDKIEVEKKK
ncbi:MAG: hypothetical protein A2551_06925 [Elusimicrobia bacterium RIFOXYD2_FULL_34_30]|nr:MAG: hypothetical protein A2551_06925 [Elusimicrobia bacterium RIFOXYD2_FULL_34_30]